MKIVLLTAYVVFLMVEFNAPLSQLVFFLYCLGSVQCVYEAAIKGLYLECMMNLISAANKEIESLTKHVPRQETPIDSKVNGVRGNE